MPRYTQHLVPFFALAAIMVAVSGCNRLGAGQQGALDSPGRGTMVRQGHPSDVASTLTPGAVRARPGTAGYPAPRPTTKQRPTWTPRPTPDYAAALPPGAIVDWKAMVNPTALDEAEQSKLVLYTLRGEPGVAVVDMSSQPPVRRWSLSEANLFAAPIRGIDILYVAMCCVGILVTTDTSKELLTLEADDEIAVRDRLLLPDVPTEAADWSLAHVDLSGDGAPERLLLVKEPFRAWFYPASGGNIGPPTPPVASIEGPLQLFDVTGDGVLEALTPVGDRRWQVYAWRGERLVASEVLTDPGSAAPVKVLVSSLGPMTRDLFFWRDGQVIRVGRAGGPLEVVYDGPNEPGWKPLAANWDGPTGERPYAVSRDGQRLVVVESRAVERPRATAESQEIDDWEYRFHVLDLARRQTANVAWYRTCGDDREPPGGWDLSADGRWLVFARHHCRGTGGPDRTVIVAVDLAASAPAESILASCKDFDAGGEHGIRECHPWIWIAPDSRSLAFTIPEALRWVSLFGGGERTLVGTHFGAREADIRTYSVEAWSPDARRLLLHECYYESCSSVVLDLESGRLLAVPDAHDGYYEWSDLVWSGDGRALVHSRFEEWRASPPLRWVWVEGPPAREAGQGERLPVARESSLLPVWNLHHGADLLALALTAAPDGSVRFVLCDPLGQAYYGDGVFSVQPDGSRLVRLASLPHCGGASQANCPCDGLRYAWADDASLLLLRGWSSEADAPPSEPVLLVPADGGPILDIGPVVRGGTWFTWTGEATVP